MIDVNKPCTLNPVAPLSFVTVFFNVLLCEKLSIAARISLRTLADGKEVFAWGGGGGATGVDEVLRLVSMIPEIPRFPTAFAGGVDEEAATGVAFDDEEAVTRGAFDDEEEVTGGAFEAIEALGNDEDDCGAAGRLDALGTYCPDSDRVIPEVWAEEGNWNNNSFKVSSSILSSAI